MLGGGQKRACWQEHDVWLRLLREQMGTAAASGSARWPHRSGQPLGRRRAACAATRARLTAIDRPSGEYATPWSQWAAAERRRPRGSMRPVERPTSIASSSARARRSPPSTCGHPGEKLIAAVPRGRRAARRRPLRPRGHVDEADGSRLVRHCEQPPVRAVPEGRRSRCRTAATGGSDAGSAAGRRTGRCASRRGSGA